MHGEFMENAAEYFLNKESGVFRLRVLTLKKT